MIHQEARHAAAVLAKQSFCTAATCSRNNSLLSALHRNGQKIMTTNAARWDAESTQNNGFFSTFSNLASRLANAQIKRRTLAALAELDDHALLDIGVNPGEVRRSHRSVTDWVVQSHSGTARLVFIGR
jgi:uncharacterized protein YjiS (DUF1127 family)